MRILIVGGAGFIGSHIADRLGSHDLVILDDLSAGRKENIGDLPLIRKSVVDVKKRDVEGFDIIIHCAAQVSTFISVDYPERDFQTNCLGTFKLFEAIRKYNKDALIIYTSSRSVYGDIPAPLVANEECAFVPSTFYNVHKRYGENLLRIYKKLYGMRFVILRPSNVYGERQPYWKDGWYDFISFWLKLAIQNKPLPIFGTGNQTRDYVHVTDTAEAYGLVVERAVEGENFLLASGKETSLNDLAQLILKITGSKAGVEYYPARNGDIQRFVGSNIKALISLGWKPTIGLEEGLIQQLCWLKKELG